MRDEFDLEEFLPYLLNRAAERTGLGFQRIYKARYGMLRTEWRVLFHLGRHGAMTARDICARADLHKTKVSRAVAALERRRFLKRETSETDRRFETLALTSQGVVAFRALEADAQAFQDNLAGNFTVSELEILTRCLVRLAGR